MLCDVVVRDTTDNQHTALEHLETAESLPDFVPVRARTATQVINANDRVNCLATGRVTNVTTVNNSLLGKLGVIASQHSKMQKVFRNHKYSNVTITIDSLSNSALELFVFRR